MRRLKWPSLFFSAWLCCGALYAASLDTPPVIAHLRSVLHDEIRPTMHDGNEYIEWRSDWVLQWEAMPGAVEYELTFKTSEGISSNITQQNKNIFKLEVAKGKNPKADGMATRVIQLATIQSLLSVSVTARFADGSRSAPSQWLEVGRIYP